MGVNAQEYGYFFNSNNSDRTYNAESFEAWIKPLMTNGVFGTGMQVSAQSTPDMSVSVAAGYANINGKLGAWPTANTMTIATASGLYPRWDVIVLRRDNTNRKITLEVKTGTASLTPSAPAPTRDADIYELVLAQIYVTAGTTSITNANIVDKRTDTSLCGLVTCPIVNPDFTPLYQQFTAQFEDWFDHMKDQLDDDAAGHLQLEIDDIKADIGIVEDTDTATHTIAAGQYVIWKGSLYKAAAAIPASTALSLSNLTAVSNGLGGEVASLNGNISALSDTVANKYIYQLQEIDSPSGFDGTQKETSISITMKTGYTPHVYSVSSNNYNSAHFVQHFSQPNNIGSMYIDHNLNSNATKIRVYIVWEKT